MIVEFCTTVALTGLIILVYLAFFWKINWIKDVTIQRVKSARFVAKYQMRKSREIGNLPPVYPNGWFGLLESSALKKGQVEYVAALGQNFAVFRTESGAVRILNAYCPHMGANLGEGGRVVGEELECPFHSWRFSGETGKCTNVPYSKSVPGAIKTKVWDSLVVNGVIFVWYHAESDPPDWWPQQIDEISNGTWQYQGRNEFYVNCHIQEIPENGADWAHFNAVHSRAILANDFFSKIAYHSWSNAAWSTDSSSISQKSSFLLDDSDLTQDSAQQKQTEKHKATSRLTHNLVLFEKFSTLELHVEARQIGPGYVELHLQSAFGPMCIIQTVTPLQPLIQRVTHQMFAPPRLGLFSRLVLIGESIMFERDVVVWNYKKFVENPMLVTEDKTIKAYRRWYKQFYSERSPTYKSCKDTVDW